jgi:hypothetical protein
MSKNLVKTRKQLEELGLMTLRDVAYLTGLDTKTILRWYRWRDHKYFKFPEGIELPRKELVDVHSQVCFKIADKPRIEEVSYCLQTDYRGMMSHVNSYFGSLFAPGFPKLTENRVNIGLLDTWLATGYVDVRIRAMELKYADRDTVADEYVEMRDKLIGRA